MSNSRRRFSKDFKAKVVMEALKERETMESLAKKYELQPAQISTWKREVIANFGDLFGKSEGKSKSESEDLEGLYARIGKLEIQNEFLKKKLYR